MNLKCKKRMFVCSRHYVSIEGSANMKVEEIGAV